MKNLSLLLAAFVIVLSNAKAQTKKVLFIGIDGCIPAAINSTNAPNLANLESIGTYSHDALTMFPTVSGPGWGSMLTGYWDPNRTMVVDNTFSPANFYSWPHFYKLLKTVNPSLKTASLASWTSLNPNILAPSASACNYTYDGAGSSYAARDLDIKNKAVAALSSASPNYDIVFVHFDQVDGEGHSTGFSSGNILYTNALKTVDGYIGNLLTAMQARPGFASEQWLIVVSTDHGGTGTSHGGNTLAEENTFAIFTDYNASTIPANNNLAKTVSTVSINNATALGNAGGASPKRYATISKQPSLNFGSDSSFTIECRVKTSGWSSDAAIIADKNWASGYNAGFALAGNPSGGTWKFNMGDGTNRLDLDGRVINDNNWHHIAVVVDRQRGIATIYQDGIPYGKVKCKNVKNINTSSPINIGQDGTGTYNPNFTGYVNEVRIWNGALTESTLAQWANTSLNNTHPNASQLVGYYKMNEGSGTIITDTKTAVNGLAANNGSLVSSVTWASQPGNITINNYSNTPKIVDIVPTIMDWLCYDYKAYNFDGKPVVNGLCNQSACNAPAGLMAISITGFDAKLKWNHVAGINNYTVEYKPVSSGSWITAGTTATDSLVVNGLSPKITYDYRVKSSCSGYSSATFTTINELKYCFEYDLVNNTWPSGTLSKTFQVSPVNGLSFTKTISGATSEITSNLVSTDYSTDGVSPAYYSIDINFNGSQPDSLDFDFVFNKPVKITNILIKDVDRIAGNYTDAVKVTGKKWNNSNVSPTSIIATNGKYINITGNEVAARDNGISYQIPQTPDIEGQNGDIYFGFDTVRLKSYKITYFDSITSPGGKGIYIGGFCITYTPPLTQNITNTLLSSNGNNPPVQNTSMVQYADDDGTVDSITFTNLPNAATMGTLYLNGVPVTSLSQVTNLSPAALSQLAFKPVSHYAGTVVLNYYGIDNDGYRSAPSTYSIPVGSTLPLNLLSFTAALQSGHALLKWSTVNEVNSDRFEIERSVDGSVFTKAGTIAANNSTFVNWYSFDDAGISSGKYYYRLKIVDIDGQYSYSPVRLINMTGISSLVVFPNPAREIINATLSGSNRIRQIRVYDASSRLVWLKDNCNESSADINLSGLSNGWYVIDIIDADQHPYRSKFLKE